MKPKVVKQYEVQKSHKDYEPFKKVIFRMKIEGSHNTVLRNAFMMGYLAGHEFGKTMGTVQASDLEEGFAEYMTWLDANLKDEKPT